MMMKRSHFFALLGLFILSFALSFVLLQGREAQDKVLLFVTVGLDREQLLNEVSSYEAQRASEHFSDVLLGWTVSPAFREKFTEAVGAEFSYSGQRQEKQNLLFAFTQDGGAMEETAGLRAAEYFLSQLESDLELYKADTHEAYVLTLPRNAFVEGESAALQEALGAALFVSLGVLLALFAWDYARSTRH